MKQLQKILTQQNMSVLAGKTVAMTGCTGGIGTALCRYFAALGIHLIMLDRNPQKSAALRAELQQTYPQIQCESLIVDLEDMESVKAAAAVLLKKPPHFFIHNAGAYSIPRHRCSTGFNNVFQINFVSPYYLIRTLTAHNPDIKVIAMGSIAHNYAKADFDDVDFSTRKPSNLVYGNAKRYLMFSLYEAFDGKDNLAVVHPGITFTNITNHYPKWLFCLIKHPMKTIFPPPHIAALCVIKGLIASTPHSVWIGPWILDIWGLPHTRRLHTCTKKEAAGIGQVAQEIYQKMLM